MPQPTWLGIFCVGRARGRAESAGVRWPELSMNLRDVLAVLGGTVDSSEVDLEQEIVAGAAADLMSDVLAFARPDCVLLTGLTHHQVVRTAEMAGIRAIVFVRGKRPPLETIRLAEEVGIPLLCTRFSLYEACGLLHSAGLPASMPAPRSA